MEQKQNIILSILRYNSKTFKSIIEVKYRCWEGFSLLYTYILKYPWGKLILVLFLFSFYYHIT